MITVNALVNYLIQFSLCVIQIRYCNYATCLFNSHFIPRKYFFRELYTTMKKPVLTKIDKCVFSRLINESFLRNTSIIVRVPGVILDGNIFSRWTLHWRWGSFDLNNQFAPIICAFPLFSNTEVCIAHCTCAASSCA